MVLVKGNVPELDDVDEIEMAEPEPGADWGSVDQLRRALVLSLFSDKQIFGRGEFDQETLRLRDAIRQKKVRMAA